MGFSLLRSRELLAEYVAKILASGGPADRPSDIPVQFTVGQQVKTRVHGNTFVDGGHTRLPCYARGKRDGSFSITVRMFSQTAMHTVWAKPLNRCIPLGFMRGICGTTPNIKKMKWCWICGNPIWNLPDG